MHAKRMDKIATGVLYTISGIIVAILAALILYILVRGLPHVSWHFLTGKSSSYQAGGGIGIQLYNSFFLLVITLVISFPLSLGAGIYLSEYAITVSQREAGLALGLSRWETVIHVVVPEALPSIVTGVVLASGRIFGEAAALIYTAGQSAPALDWSNWNIFSVTSPISIFRQAETLAVHIWKVNSEGTIPDSIEVSAGSAAVLLIFILIFNFGARKLGSYLHKKLTSA